MYIEYRAFYPAAAEVDCIILALMPLIAALIIMITMVIIVIMITVIMIIALIFVTIRK